MQKITTQKGNGLTAPHDQPAKTLTKHTADFIARLSRFATVDAGFMLCCAVLLVQAVLLASGVLQ